MTFTINERCFRITLNIQSQLFMAVDRDDENNIGYGITIEQAVNDLN